MSVPFDAYCLSAYLTFRYVPRDGAAWCPGVVTHLPRVSEEDQIPVRDAGDVRAALGDLVRAGPSTGLLLSGGIDSAILASFLPEGTRAYTIRFAAEGALDESPRAQAYARLRRLDLRVVTVTWDDYVAHAPWLMQTKNAPLHAIEVPLHRAAAEARADGIDTLIVGNGADSTFGGLDKLLARDWTYAEFVRRYTFVEPRDVLERPAPTDGVWAPFVKGAGFDVQGFLKKVHGLGIVQSFENAARAAGVTLRAPYEQLRLAAPLDVARIRAGDTKYVLRDLYRELYPGIDLPEKVAFARPMDRWLSAWRGPERPEFRRDLDVASLSGEQRWLVHCLDRFLSSLDPS